MTVAGVDAEAPGGRGADADAGLADEIVEEVREPDVEQDTTTRLSATPTAQAHRVR